MPCQKSLRVLNGGCSAYLQERSRTKRTTLLVCRIWREGCRIRRTDRRIRWRRAASATIGARGCQIQWGWGGRWRRRIRKAGHRETTCGVKAKGLTASTTPCYAGRASANPAATRKTGTDQGTAVAATGITIFPPRAQRKQYNETNHGGQEDWEKKQGSLGCLPTPESRSHA